MTTPITTQQRQAVPEKRREWCCGTPITGPHEPGCPSEPRPDDLVDYSGPVVVASEPPSAPPVAPAAAPPRSYGISRSQEDDLELPSGDLVRYRKLRRGQLLEMNLVEIMDAFTPELLAEVGSDDSTTAGEAAMRAIADPERNRKIFGPVDRVVAAAVVIPRVVLEGPTTNEQVNVADIELEDKLAIFSAAIGEQLAALKSIRGQPAPGI